MIELELRDFIAIGSLFVTCGLGVGFIMVTRNMVNNLKLDVKRINGMPERMVRIETAMEYLEKREKDRERQRQGQ